jgi:hypothetical protein
MEDPGGAGAIDDADAHPFSRAQRAAAVIFGELATDKALTREKVEEGRTRVRALLREWPNALEEREEAFADLLSLLAEEPLGRTLPAGR